MSTLGQAEDIDHGSMRGYRQHHRRKVLPVCDDCIAAKAKADAATDADRSAEHGWNANRSSDRRLPGARGLGTVGEPTAWERRKTARLLASRATDRDELRELLAAAGVTAEDGKRPPGPRDTR